MKNKKKVSTKTLLTACVITKDEEEKIKDCLKSVSFADETLVIDTGSTDKTPVIAKRMGARVVSFTKGSFNDWRNKGLKEAKGKWILYVDSDERVSVELQKEVLSAVSDQRSTANVYAIPRRNFIFGKEFKHSAQYPDYQKRLFLCSKLKKWKGEVHEEPIFEGKLGHLKNPLTHLKHNSLHEMMEKTNKWSEIEAKLMYDANHPKMNVVRFFTAMWREFWLRMIKQRGFLDDAEGVIYALYQVYSKFVSYAKLYELQLRDANIRIHANVANKY